MKKVAIYSTPTCHFCHDAKEFFKENNIAYDEYDVSTDATRRDEMIKKTGKMAVPVITITDLPAQAGESGNEEVLVGFDKEKLASVLGV